MPQKLELPVGTNIVDIIGLLDNMYYERIKNDDKSHNMDFLDKKVHSILQLLWNPENGEFYEDVGIELITPTQTEDVIPIEKDWCVKIPDQAWIVLTPDAGC
ncbi:MAG: hypothetical protein ACTSWX_10440 [Promethearchaeota archaeon]